jgi:hypothetical protein
MHTFYGHPTGQQEMTVAPNLAITGDRDPRERGSRPLNSNR